MRNGQLPGRVQAKEVAPRFLPALAGSLQNIISIRTAGSNETAPIICCGQFITKAACVWRRERDSNPRGQFPQPTRLAGERLQPLGHLSARGRHSISQPGAVAILIAENFRPAAAIARGRFDAQRRARIRTGRSLITPAPAFLRRFSVSGDAAQNFRRQPARNVSCGSASPLWPGL